MKHTKRPAQDFRPVIQALLSAAKALEAGGTKPKARGRTLRAETRQAGELVDGVWMGEELVARIPLSEILEAWGQDHLAKWVRDPFVELGYNIPIDDVVSGNGSKIPDEVLEILEETARFSYMSCLENAIEGYRVQEIERRVLALLDTNGTASYEGENQDGEEVHVTAPYDVVAVDGKDSKDVYSDAIIEVRMENPVHMSNTYEEAEGYSASHLVDEPYGDAEDALNQAIHLTKQNDSHGVKALSDIDDSNAYMDWLHFAEWFGERASDLSPLEVAEQITAYAEANDLAPKDVLKTLLAGLPVLQAKAGAIASALDGGYDPRQQKMPFASVKARLLAGKKRR